MFYISDYVILGSVRLLSNNIFSININEDNKEDSITIDLVVNIILT